MTAARASSPRVLVVQADLSAETLQTIVEAAPDFTVVSRAELDLTPSWLERAEVLFTQNSATARLGTAAGLRWVQTYGAGVEWLLGAPAMQRVAITNASGIHAQPIAEHVLGLMLAYARNLHRAERQQVTHVWSSESLRHDLRTLEGATLGILGLGAIGARIAAVATAFGMQVVGLRRSGGAVPGVARVYDERGLHELLSQSNYLVNALPLTARTRHLIGAREFAALPQGAFVVNIGRGATFDTDALVEALGSGRVGGAGLDVTEPEPLPPDHALWRFENVIITPHYAGAHPGYEQRVTAIFLDNLARYRAGQPLLNLVDPSAGY